MKGSAKAADCDGEHKILDSAACMRAFKADTGYSFTPHSATGGGGSARKRKRG
jgi:hypothetical protein